MELTEAERGEALAERTADRIRDELLATLQELERRRERLARVRGWLRDPEAKEGAAVLLLLAASAAAGLAWWRLGPSRVRGALRPWLGPLLRQAVLTGGRAWLRGRARELSRTPVGPSSLY